MPFRWCYDVPTKIDDRKCSGCGDCIDVCPVSPCVYTKVIIKNRIKVIIKHPDKCIECGSCINVCPEEALQMDR